MSSRWPSHLLRSSVCVGRGPQHCGLSTSTEHRALDSLIKWVWRQVGVAPNEGYRQGTLQGKVLALMGGRVWTRLKRPQTKCVLMEGPFLSCHGLFAPLSSQPVEGSKWGIIRANDQAQSVKLEETSSFSQLFPGLLTTFFQHSQLCVLNTEGGGSAGGGCQDELVRGDELPSDNNGNKTPPYSAEILLHLAKCCFSSSLRVEVNSHRAEFTEWRIRRRENKQIFKTSMIKVILSNNYNA